MPPPASSTARWPAIDLLRGLTVVVMILVNEWAGVAGLPAWLRHVPADADAMTVVDMVFPAFLFIVGMSLPLALQSRLEQAGRNAALRGAAERTAALVVTGLFMVNAEMAPASFNASGWLLGAFLGVFLAWGSAAGGPALPGPVRLAGLALLAALAYAYPGGMGLHWWGILGLIGWAYGLAALLFIGAAPGSRLLLALAALPVCVAWFAFAAPRLGGGAHATHALLVLAGMAATLLLQNVLHAGLAPDRATRVLMLLGFMLLALGFSLRPYWPLSKIQATPSWGLVCAGATLLLYLLLRPLAEAAPGRAAMRLLGDAARHPLLAYLLPFVIGAVLALAGWQWPAALGAGWPGLLRGVAFLAIVLVLLRLLLRLGIRLKL
jgi:heparan-alpha-glucosaminide N-acetyltransferase